MKLWILPIFFLFISCSQSVSFSITQTSSATAQELSTETNPTVGLLIDQESNSFSLSQYILELMETQLISTDFKVQVGYDKIKLILEEEKLSYSDLFNPNTRSELGKKLGVTYLIVINNLVEKKDKQHQIMISIKIINIETGKITGILNILQSPVVWTVHSDDQVDYAFSKVDIEEKMVNELIEDFLKNLRRQK
jgi:hypothetical protein